jgi:hypothetical protein
MTPGYKLIKYVIRASLFSMVTMPDLPGNRIIELISKRIKIHKNISILHAGWIL